MSYHAAAKAAITPMESRIVSARRNMFEARPRISGVPALLVWVVWPLLERLGLAVEVGVLEKFG